MKTKTKIFFDFDGTLVTSMPYYKKFSEMLEKAAIEYFGNDGIEKLNKYRSLFNGAGEMTVGDYPDFGKIWYKKILTIDPSKYFEIDKQLSDFLESLSDYDLFIYSNSPEEQIKKVLRAKEINPNIFKGIVGWKFSQQMLKPNIGNLKKILREFKIDSQNCIFVGDSQPIDLDPADRLGIRTIFFKRNNSFRDLTNLLDDI